MARNESKRNLGKSTRGALTELGAMLQSLAPPLGRQPGEFTAADAASEWGKTIDAADGRLRRLVDKGDLQKREGRENSRVVTFYRKA